MESLLTKSEFLKRLELAIKKYNHRFGGVCTTAGTDEKVRIAVAAARECNLPAKPYLIDPITLAITELGHLGTVNPFDILIQTESAWEHLLHNEEAYKTFKELNP